jgi:hypothetical protein
VNDEEILRRAAQLERGKREAYEREITERYLAERAQRDKEDREFAANLGVTWEQYEEIVARAYDQFWDNK